ncbi:ATP-binding protein [Dietzia sp. CQ4]|uniref:ATP-binding protein n=1 Tax=Dietzia sp. (strain CQ4) TaxID=370437 RepID=UPI0015FDBEE2|nr:ATP-binding protein [Dietzia sp. CQ4]MBB1033566.1 ATP-binding protein [Dietzia sp. CQ4]
MSTDHETALMDYVQTILASAGVVLVTGPNRSARTTLLRRIANDAARADAIVNTITVDDTTSTEAISALCGLRSGVLAIDGLDATDPIPALMTNDDGTAILATCHALDAAGALDRLISAALAQGLSDRAAARLVHTHVDLVLVTGRNLPPATTPGGEFTITAASAIDGSEPVPVYVTGPRGGRLMLPTAHRRGGRR